MVALVLLARSLWILGVLSRQLFGSNPSCRTWAGTHNRGFYERGDVWAIGPFASQCDLLAGAEAHICIFQTAMGAMKAGYQPWIAADAVSSRDGRNAELALKRMQGLGMTVGPTEMAIYELLYKAGSPAFKAMLPHLK